VPLVPWRTPVQPLADGRYRLRLGAEERSAVGSLCAELRSLLEADDRAVPRLFPPAHRDDPATAAEFDRLTRESLVGGRLAALTTVERTLHAELLDEEELAAWCGAVNDLRLVLGERLGVAEDMDESLYRTSPDHALYAWLTGLHAATVEALASRL
jgi:Lon protease-like protein